MSTKINVNIPKKKNPTFADLKIGDVFHLACNREKSTCVKVSAGSRFSYYNEDIIPTHPYEEVVVAKSVDVNY